MAESLGITTHRTIPTALAAFIELHTRTYLSTLGDSSLYKVQHYAGEFLAEDNLERLTGAVKQFPHILYDVELIDEVDTDGTQTMPEDTFSFIIFCCHSNFFDESIQWRSSYELAWDVRAGFQGVEFANTPDIVANGFFIPKSIERELHVPGMSVHTFRLEAQVVHDVSGVLNNELQGGYLFDSADTSHYIPLT